MKITKTTFGAVLAFLPAVAAAPCGDIVLAPAEETVTLAPHASHDFQPPSTGTWWVCGEFGNLSGVYFKTQEFTSGGHDHGVELTQGSADQGQSVCRSAYLASGEYITATNQGDDEVQVSFNPGVTATHDDVLQIDGGSCKQIPTDPGYYIYLTSMSLGELQIQAVRGATGNLITTISPTSANEGDSGYTASADEAATYYVCATSGPITVGLMGPKLCSTGSGVSQNVPATKKLTKVALTDLKNVINH